MVTITIREAQARLLDLIHELKPGDELIITENDQPVAVLIASPRVKPYPLPGRGKGMLTVLMEDDEHLEDFTNYLT